MTIMQSGDDDVKQAVQRWMEDVVIGLNLCPFAAKPHANNQIRICVSDAVTEAALLEDLQFELKHLEQTPVTELETTLLAIPKMLADFSEYNQFLDWVDQLLNEFGWAGIYQVATFHPAYQFAETDESAAENLTNRSPVPVLHLIREASLEKALSSYPNPEEIPERNIQTMESLADEDIQRLFPYVSPSH